MHKIEASIYEDGCEDHTKVFERQTIWTGTVHHYCETDKRFKHRIENIMNDYIFELEDAPRKLESFKGLFE